jgi:hypothetical protein
MRRCPKLLSISRWCLPVSAVRKLAAHLTSSLIAVAVYYDQQLCNVMDMLTVLLLVAQYLRYAAKVAVMRPRMSSFAPADVPPGSVHATCSTVGTEHTFEVQWVVKGHALPNSRRLLLCSTARASLRSFTEASLKLYRHTNTINECSPMHTQYHHPHAHAASPPS